MPFLWKSKIDYVFYRRVLESPLFFNLFLLLWTALRKSVSCVLVVSPLNAIIDHHVGSNREIKRKGCRCQSSEGRWSVCESEYWWHGQICVLICRSVFGKSISADSPKIVFSNRVIQSCEGNWVGSHFEIHHGAVLGDAFQSWRLHKVKASMFNKSWKVIYLALNCLNQPKIAQLQFLTDG